MNKREYQKIFDLEETHWWYRGLRSLVISFLRKLIEKNNQGAKILDLGCGTGGLTKRLESFGEVWGVDISKIALDYAVKRKLKNLKLASIEKLSFRNNFFDFVIVLDVICQKGINDNQALKEIWRVLKPKGILILNEPAYQWLLSGHDHAVDTARRYKKRELFQKFSRAGFKIIKISYRNCLLFPILFLVRLVKKFFPASSDLNRPSKIENWLGDLALKIENKLLGFVNLPFGLSVFAVVKKES